MKKVIALTFVLVLFVQTSFAEENISRIISHYNKVTENFVPLVSTEQNAVFADLIGYEWAHKSIYELSSENIISGRSEGIFAPGENVKIKEFIKLTVLVCGLYDEEAKSSFKNIDQSDWSYLYVASAEKAGILDFLSDDTDFERSITRVQMATISAKALEIAGVEIKEDYSSLFTDDDQIDYSAKKYVYALKKIGIVSGMGDGTFLPDSNLRRCESAVIIYKMQNYIKNIQ